MASDYPNYYHPLFIVPIFLLSIFSSFGILISFKNLNFKSGYLLLNLFLIIIIFSLFFILPRYKMMILPVQLIFMNYFFIAYSKKLGFIKKLFLSKWSFRKIMNSIDIILPTYNCEKYIEETINSIIGQSFENWKLIIVHVWWSKNHHTHRKCLFFFR